jgi:hypothetical protein
MKMIKRETREIKGRNQKSEKGNQKMMLTDYSG